MGTFGLSSGERFGADEKGLGDLLSFAEAPEYVEGRAVFQLVVGVVQENVLEEIAFGTVLGLDKGSL